ncbi:MAG TPA: hypothetical protein VFP96_09990, partial [Candidatus Acidoferrum sp.]|nr:hypothetical protein [Candidatus Acidoferrum sp.]
NPRNYRTPAEFSQAHQTFLQGLFGKEMMMEEMAEESGGRAFYNTNGLADAVATAVRDGATHYTLSYSPSNENFDGSVRKVLVRLKQKGVTLSYRRSYMALDAPELDATDRLEATMGRGAPLGRGLVFELRVRSSGAPTAPSPVQRRALSGFEPFSTSQLRDKVLLQSYSLQFTTNRFPSSSTAGASGSAAGTMELGIDAYDAENRLVWRERHVLTIDTERGRQTRVLRFAQSVEIPSTAAWLRVGLQDVEAANVGSLEIPLAGKMTTTNPGAASAKEAIRRVL